MEQAGLKQTPGTDGAAPQPRAPCAAPWGLTASQTGKQATNQHHPAATTSPATTPHSLPAVLLSVLLLPKLEAALAGAGSWLPPPARRGPVDLPGCPLARADHAGHPQVKVRQHSCTHHTRHTAAQGPICQLPPDSDLLSPPCDGPSARPDALAHLPRIALAIHALRRFLQARVWQAYSPCRAPESQEPAGVACRGCSLHKQRLQPNPADKWTAQELVQKREADLKMAARLLQSAAACGRRLQMPVVPGLEPDGSEVCSSSCLFSAADPRHPRTPGQLQSCVTQPPHNTHQTLQDYENGLSPAARTSLRSRKVSTAISRVALLTLLLVVPV